MHHQQRDFVRPAETPTEPPLDINYVPAARHKPILAAFLNALHESRRLKARRILRQYEHLIATPRERIPHELKPEFRGQEMLIPGSAAQAKLARRPAPGEMGWLVAVAVAFIMIHIVAGTIWLRASATGKSDERFSESAAINAAKAPFNGPQSLQKTPAEAFRDPIEASRQPGASSRQQLPFDLTE